MPAGLWGLHVRLGVPVPRCPGRWVVEPSADFTCRCGHVSSASGAAAVARFAETAAARHGAVCPLKAREDGK